jgi:hypothetical protein
MSKSALNAKLDSFLTLKNGWDGYGGKAPTKKVVEKAKEIASLLPIHNWQAVPASNNSIQLEFHNLEFDLEIYISLSKEADNE